MKNYGYYSFIDDKKNINSCSMCSDKHPLMVNCAGSFNTDFPFTTNNPSGRLDYYLMCMVSGVLSVSCYGDTVSISAGDVIIIPPNTPYKYTNASSEHMSYLWVHFTGSHAEKVLEAYGFKYFPEVFTTSDVNSLSLKFKTIFDAYSKKDGFRDAELSALFDLLLISITRSCASPESLSNELVRSVRIIKTSYNTDIKIPDLAKAEHLSVSRYNFLFKKQFGISPTKYILRLRMNCARDLLDSTDLSVKQIGLVSGYNDSHFFSKTFKSFTGMSPSEYRERHKK
ncbi:MAG: helix-turn-helix transcriptional regulator [Clostridia bacterium]|nr:helix-turn-helix transcriptional regulator [Clostridia bacterium]